MARRRQKQAKSNAKPRKESQIHIRVTADQKTLLLDAATEAGLGLSGWLLSVGLREAKKASAG